MKTCKKCGTDDRYDSGNCRTCTKANSAAWYASNQERKKETSALYLAANIKRKKETDAAWRAANHEKIKAKNAALYAEKSDKILLMNALYRAANPNKVKTKDAAWAKANPEARRVNRQNRRARKHENGGILSKGLAAKLFKLQKGKCPCCSQPLGDDYHIDHKMPIALGGTNEDWNMQLLTARCNMQKSAKHPVEFMQERGFLI